MRWVWWLAWLGWLLAPAVPPPSVVLVTVDTLRADRLGCYGARNLSTPALDELAAAGILFQQAIAQNPTTLPSHASILTGTYPGVHGVVDFGFPLGPGNVTLAEVFQSRGYRTAAFVGALILDAHGGSGAGFDQGFETYEDGFTPSQDPKLRYETLERRADAVVRRAAKWMEGVGDQPFFAWIHLFDPHDPYEPPEPFRSRYRARPYDGEVAFTDAAIGQLLSVLKQRGLYEKSVITVIADHGESLGEHGEPAHGLFLYDSVVRIPWILKPPKDDLAGLVYRGQVRSVDVAPTLLQLSGIQIPETMQGTGLLSRLKEGQTLDHLPAYSETFYPRFQFGWSPLRSVRDGRYKYIQAPQPELYDLQADAGELRNLHGQQAARAHYLRATLARFSVEHKTAGAGDPALLERLRSLGYLAYAGSAPPEGTGPAADPKEKVKLYRWMREATLASERGDFAQALPRLEAVIAEDPGVFSAHALLGHGFYRQGQHRKAIASFERALQLRPDEPNALFYRAASHLQLGEYEEALRNFQQSARIAPAHFRVHHSMGVAFLKLGRVEEAVQAFERAVQVAPSEPEGHVSLGRMYVYQRRPEEALQEFRAALALDEKNTEVYRHMADAFLLKGDRESAAQALRKSRR
ncbi:MAG: sulfatase-like hydrolase/transferase [Acidobacteria bacterium]|nr:sulfatase-like hydrolase/transferase [Acidobacteriota bacterium]